MTALLNPETCATGRCGQCDGPPCECNCHRQPLTLRRIQYAVLANKIHKRFNVADIPLEFCLLSGEVAEAFDAWRKDRGTEVPGELADVAIYLFGIAALLGIDLQEAIEAKLAQNAARTYRRLPNGTPVKDGS